MARRMSLRSRLVTIGAALCLWSQAAGAAEGGPPRGPLDVRVDSDRLSVNLGAVPLADVLRAIAEQAGAELVIRGDLGELAPQVFTDKPLAEGIRQLVGPNGLVMTFEPVAQRFDGAPRLRSLTVSGGGASSTVDEVASPASGSTGAEPLHGRLPSVWEFGRGGDDAMVAAFAAALAQDPDAPMRAVIGASIGGAEESGADPTVRAALASGDPLERIQALRAVGARAGSGEKAVGPLVEVLARDEDPEVRRAAVEILAELASEEAQMVLEGALGDSDPTVRAAAGQALHR